MQLVATGGSLGPLARIGPTPGNPPKAGLGQIVSTEAMRIYNEDFRRLGIPSGELT